MSTNTPKAPLTKEEAAKLGGAFQRFTELRAKAVKTEAEVAELTGLSEYLAITLIDHAAEFIGCWFAVRDEYEPILGLLARVGQRVSGITAMQQAAYNAAQQPAPEPSNIIRLS